MPDATSVQYSALPHKIDPPPVCPWHAAPDDPCACEICGQYVPADQMSGFAWRHGAMAHITCLSTQMDARKL